MAPCGNGHVQGDLVVASHHLRKEEPKEIDMTDGRQKELDKEKAEALNNSALFDVHRWSDYPEANSAVDALYEELKELPDFKKGNVRLRKKHVKVVILDLYHKWLTDPMMYSAYHRNVKRYSDMDERYNKLHLSKLTIPIVDALVKLGYIENHNGHYGRTGGSSHIARMKAEDKLVRLIKDDHHVTPEMVELARDKECVILRTYDEEKGKQVDIPYVDTLETHQMRKDLQAYNNLLRRNFIDIPHFPKEGVTSRNGTRKIKYNHNDKFVRRIFNNGTWDDGGRFYGGWWQRLPKNWRKSIQFGSAKVAEADYSGLHIVLLYALSGIDYWDTIDRDPYQIDGYERSERMRSLLKQVLLTAINAKDHTSAVGSVRWEINKDWEEYGWVRDAGLDIGDVINRFADQHHPIKSYFFSNYGVKLQRIDSIMAEHVINTFTNQGVLVLCVHDSFIVSSYHEEELHELMDEALDKILETLPDVDSGTKARIDTTGMTRNEYNYFRTQASAALMNEEWDIRDWALKQLGNGGPMDTDHDFEMRRIKFQGVDWEKNYYGTPEP